jgi:zinc protease
MYHNIVKNKGQRPTAGLFIAYVVLTALILVSFCGNPIFAIGATLNVAGAASDGSTQLPLWPHEGSDLEPDPDIFFGKLDNGFRFALMKNQNPKKRVSMHLNIQAGSAHESDAQQGLAHFLEHMLFCGSENFAPGELVKYFQSIGMQFGPDANAHTGFYETVYDILLPEGDEENLKKGLLVMKDYAQSALLLKSEIERERKVVLAEKRTRDSASYRTFESTIQFELPDARISRRLPIGREEILQEATQQDFKEYYDTWYRPDNMMVVAVGDFDIQLASSLIREYFGGMTARSNARPTIPFGDIHHQGIKPFYHHEEESGSATVTLEVLTKEEIHKDTAEMRRQMIKKDLADEIVQNRLDALIGREGIPGTSAAVGSGVYLKHIRYAMITAEGSPETWESMLRFLEQTLRKALVHGFTEPELDRVKKDFLAELEQAVKKKDTRESKDLARRIIRQINSERVFLSPEKEKELLAPYIQALTLKEVHDAFKDSWNPDHRLILLTGAADLSAGTQKPKEQILQVYNNSLQETVTPPLAESAAAFPYFSIPPGQGRIIERQDHSDVGIIQIDYENGFRLNLKQTDFKAGEILANLSFGSGRYEEPEAHPGLAELSEAVVNESGLGALSKDEIEIALAGKQTHVSFRINESAFVFHGNTIPAELRLLSQLLYAHITDPGFRSDAFQLVRNQFKNRYEEISHTLDGVMTLSGNRFLAGGDTRFGLPPREDFAKLSLEHIRQWVGRSLTEDPLELSVVGDFEIDGVIALASKYFGTLPQRKGGQHEPRSGPVFPSGKTLNIQVDTEIPSGLVYVSYPTEDIWNIHRTRRLSVLSDIFSERMRVQIREKLGEAYSPVAYNRAFRAYQGYGIFHTIVEADPAKTSLVIREIKKIAMDISQNGVTQDEVHRSLKPTLNSIKDMRQKNGYWLKTVLTGSKAHPQQIEWSRHIETDYASITPEDITKQAKIYLKNDRAAVVVAVPIPANVKD